MDYKKIGIQIPSKAKSSGKFKQEPGDFVVQEISTNGEISNLEPNKELPAEQKEYVHFTLVKRDWNQDLLLKKIARFCGLSRKRFSYAGTKDKFALTSQRVSAWKIPPEHLSQISIKDCVIGDFEPSDKKLELGDLWGNRFTIKIIDAKGTPEKITKVPNFFGEQRFGMRLNNHLIGKNLLHGNLEEAVKSFLTDTAENEFEEGKKAREFLAENWGNFKEALKIYPRYMRFERALLDRLNRYPADYVGAFKQLSKNTYKFFTHAFQSYLFNLELSERIKNKKSLSGEGNLIGYESNLNSFEKEFLEKEGLKQEQLRIKQFPEASVRGGKRKWQIQVKNFKSKKQGKDLILNFDLEKGAYATIVLREICKG